MPMDKEAESTDHSRIPETGLISERAVSAGNKDGVGADGRHTGNTRTQYPEVSFAISS